MAVAASAIAPSKTLRRRLCRAVNRLQSVFAPKNWATILAEKGDYEMARKRYSDEDILKLLREIEFRLADGNDVRLARRSVGVSDATYYNWRRRFGGMGKSQLSELRSLEKKNIRLKKIVA